MRLWILNVLVLCLDVGDRVRPGWDRDLKFLAIVSFRAGVCTRDLDVRENYAVPVPVPSATTVVLVLILVLGDSSRIREKHLAGAGIVRRPYVIFSEPGNPGKEQFLFRAK